MNTARITIAIIIFAAWAAAAATAGPGNGVHAKPAAVKVTLPTVVIVGRPETVLAANPVTLAQ